MIRRLSLLTMSALFIFAGWAFSADDGYIRLARLSYIEGQVSYQQSQDLDWAAASINMPLQPGDRIYTGRDGRSEIEFDDGSVLRLAENTDVEVVSLDSDHVGLRMLAGLTTLTTPGRLDYEIDSPAAAFHTARAGVYRFDVVENGETDAIVRKGSLDSSNDAFSRRVSPGMLLHVRPGINESPQLSRYLRRDAWDEWNERRDAGRNVYAGRRYLPSNVYMGAAELDRYGRWVNVSTYGSAWVPYSVDTYWSPYSVGRWCYRPFYGWTWISYEPWGWLPFHYGRWYQSASFGWCWIPGPAFAFNFWSPGLVAFYDGPGWVSWCPLGPGDYYNVNLYHYNRRIYGYQLSRLRALQTRSSDRPFNRDARGAFRTVQVDHFRNGSFNARSSSTRWGNIDRPWQHGSRVTERLNVRPTSNSYRAAPDRRAGQPRTVTRSEDRNVTRSENRSRSRNTDIGNNSSQPPRSANRAPEPSRSRGNTNLDRRNGNRADRRPRR